jgi:SWIRM-associated region 1
MGDIYLIPQNKAEACLSKETMLQIVEKTKQRSRRLVKAARKEIESCLDDVIYQQMRKLEHKATFLRQFWTCFESEKRELKLGKEELLAERVALSVLRGGELKGTPAERILSGNEFSSITSTLRPLE